MEMDLQQKQELRLTPQLLQSMEILQMNTADLQSFLNNELQENPVLEAEQAREAPTLAQQMDWINRQSAPRRDTWEPDEDYGAPEPSSHRWEETLEAHLLLQIEGAALTASEAACARYLIHCVDSRGYLREEPAAFAQRFGLHRTDAWRVLSLLRSLDPPGICAFDLRSCLLAQLRLLPDTALAQRVTAEYLEEVARSRYGVIAHALGVSTRSVEKAVAVIRTLDPAPGAAFPSGEDTAYIVPDVFILREAGGYAVHLNDSLLPQLSISEYYAALLRESPGGEVQDYLNERLNRARWIMNCVQQRQDTLRRCAETILEVQRGFFSGTEQSLVPMTMQDVAGALGLHPSTVSRAVRGKYLQCDRGVFALRTMFVRSLSSGETAVSSDHAKRRIRALIAEEAPAKPLSDQKLCDLLTQEGVQISRRTVAKYREELHIPGSSLRKKAGQKT